MKRVIIESPWAGLACNESYLNAAIRDCLSRGETPFASHGLYTKALRDEVPEERRLGMLAAQDWYRVAEGMVVYTDFGISPGMKAGIEFGRELGLVVEYRALEAWMRDHR